MQVIYPHRRQKQQPKRTPKNRRIARYIVLALAGFVALNLVILGFYNGRTYPNTTLAGVGVGNKSFRDVELTATRSDLLPTSIMLVQGTQKATLSLADIGARPDVARTAANLKAPRSWLPLANLFTRHVLAAPLAIDNNSLNKTADRLAPAFHEAAENARVTLTGTSFTVVEAKNGHDLDQQNLSAAIMKGIDQDQAQITVPVSSKPPSVTDQQAKAAAKSLNASLKTKLTLQHNAATEKPSAKDIISWYKPAYDSYAPDDFAIRTYVSQAGMKMGVRPSNLTAAVATIKDALSKSKQTTVTLTPFTSTKTYHYCAAVKGASASYLTSLKQELAATYSDLRGWSLDGQIEYLYSETNCDFTVWLAAPAEMASFGAICDDYWSCNVGTNVVINLDRWNTASEPWKQYGGSLRDYHIMAINHETGHMLGFGHNTCPGAGQAAPVMMQQSVALQGCTFNIWPVQSELDTLRRVTGL